MDYFANFLKEVWPPLVAYPVSFYAVMKFIIIPLGFVKTEKKGQLNVPRRPRNKKRI